MTLVKTSILSIIATTVKMFSGLVIFKAAAVYVGPSGIALIGQFQNFSQIILGVGSGGTNTGITKYTAEYGKNNPRLEALFSTAIKLSIFVSLTVGVTIAAFANYASISLLRSEDYSSIFIIFGFTLIFFVINGLLLSILNGLKEIKTFISITIIQSVCSLVFTSLLIIFFGLYGALLALVTNQSIVFFIVLWMLRKHQIIKLSNFTGAFDKFEAKKLMGFSAMALTSALVIPVSHLIIRSQIGETLSWEQAGYWQAMWSISTMYLMVATTALITYYLPKLSELQSPKELRNEITNGYKIIIPIIIFLALIIYMSKDLIIKLLFTDDFYPMRELFKWQLVGDTIKMSSWLLGYLLKAKAMFSAFIIKEIVLSFLFVLFTFILISRFKLQGVLYAYCLVYIINFVWTFYLVKPILKMEKI